MNLPHRLAALALCAFAVVTACGDDDDDDESGEPLGGASGNAGRGGSGAASLGGAPKDSGAGGSERGGVSDQGGMGTAVAGGSGGEIPASGGGAGGEEGQPKHWLAFQPWVEDEYPHALFLTEVPAVGEPVRVAEGVDFWQWSPDGSRLIYATPASYGEAPNAAFSVAVSRAGALGVPQPLHEALEDGAYVWRLSISPEGKTLALQLYQDEVSTWYLRPVDGGVREWRPVGEPVSGPEAPWVWSPDGARAAIIQRQDATHDVLSIVDARTGASTQRTFGTLRPFQWSADGSRFFVEAAGPGPGQRGLYAVDADDASSVVQLTDPAAHSGFEPGRFAASADGDTVVFAAFSGGALGGSVFMKQVNGAAPAAQLVGSNPQQLAWSESGQRFLYTAYSDSALLSLYLAPRRGEDPVALNPQGTVAGCSAPPCLRQAGEAMLFMVFDADYTGNQLYDIDLASPSPKLRLLTTFSAETVIDALVVAPDPSQILLGTKDAAGKQLIYWVDRAATPPAVTPLLQQTADISFDSPALRWSPDLGWFALPGYDGDGYASLFTVQTARAPAALAAPLTPLGSHITAVPAEWRPRP